MDTQIKRIKNHIDIKLRNRMFQMGEIDRTDPWMMKYLKKGHKAFSKENDTRPLNAQLNYWKNVHSTIENKVNAAINKKRARLSTEKRIKKATTELRLLLGKREFNKLESESAQWWESKLNKVSKIINENVRN